jgi:hypothetical protein
MSMLIVCLDCAHSYLSCQVTNEAGANLFLNLEPFCPAWISRLRIESGGVVIEDINEYARLYAMMVLNQCPKDYIIHNLTQQGLYCVPFSTALVTAGNGQTVAVDDATQSTHNSVTNHTANTASGEFHELCYPHSAQIASRY